MNITIPRETFDLMERALEEACGNRCNAEYNPCYAREALSAAKAVSADQAITAMIETSQELGLYDEAKAVQPQAHYEEQPDGTWIPVDPSEMQPQAGANPLWLATHPDGLHDVHTKKSRNWK